MCTIALNSSCKAGGGLESFVLESIWVNFGIDPSLDWVDFGFEKTLPPC